jgi:hypothetical protein
MVDLHLRKDAHYPRLIVSSPSAVSVLIQAKLYTNVYMVSGFNKNNTRGLCPTVYVSKRYMVSGHYVFRAKQRQFMY